ncbi:hypothetical protein [Streptomyces sp. AC550_RSS872]|uniref:hypothetical protein n=1 Tax=Streptomyces sp. AC550_RSS872 TaxID=2823689 RepID=UPI001C273B98|nr:hypothetical protein [Streptomyces sp. AC550_RSS872]
MSLLGVGTTTQAAPSMKSSNVTSTQAGTTGDSYAGTRLADFRSAKRLINVRSLPSKCGKTPIATAEGKGKMTLRIDDTRSAGSVLSRNIEASNGVISAGVGWDVSKSHSITVSGSKEVPRGKYGTLQAYVKYSGKKFDVQQMIGVDWWTFQTGMTAYKPIGVCFKYSER